MFGSWAHARARDCAPNRSVWTHAEIQDIFIHRRFGQSAMADLILLAGKTVRQTERMAKMIE